MYTLTDYLNDENKTVLDKTSMFLCELAEGRIFVFRYNDIYYYTFMQMNFNDFFVYFMEVRKTTREEFVKQHAKYVDKYVDADEDDTSFRVRLTEDFHSELLFDGVRADEVLPGIEIVDIYE